jgi:hypothetical protein
LFKLTVRQQTDTALVANDPFWGNLPPAGVLPPLSRGRVPLAAVPIGGVLSASIPDMCRNIMVAGPTGGGKTTFLRGMLASMLAAGNWTVIAFDRKGDLSECEMLAHQERVIVLDWSELKIAALQPPRGMP